MKNYRSIIIEDDEFMAEQLYTLLSTHNPEIKLVGVAQTSDRAEQIINELKPELIFMDIEMPDRNAFQLLENIDYKQFDIIFTTSYGHYALQAFDYNTIHYVVKPITKENIARAIERFIEKKNANKKTDLSELLTIIKQKGHMNKKIHLPRKSGFSIVSLNEIIRFEAEGSYTKVFKTTTPGKNDSELLSMGIKEFEIQLSAHNFFRCHHSHLVNLDKVKGYIKGEGGLLELENAETIPVSRSRKAELLKQLK